MQESDPARPRIKVVIPRAYTAAWAKRPNQLWPCSVLGGWQVEVELNVNGLLEIRPGDPEIPADELTAMMAAALAGALPPDLLAAMDEERGTDP